MNRRKFTGIAAALAGLLATPFAVSATNRLLPGKEDRPRPKITRLRIGNWRTTDLRRANRIAREAGRPQPRPDPPDDKSNYWADLIKNGDRYFYRAGATAVEISEYEYVRVLANPNTYYFSQALKVHLRLDRKRNGLPEPV